jgi:phosphate-selective porin
MLNSFMFWILFLITNALLAVVVTTDVSDLVINIKDPIEIKISDGNYSAKIGGRIQRQL